MFESREGSYRGTFLRTRLVPCVQSAWALPSPAWKLGTSGHHTWPDQRLHALDRGT